MRDPTVGVVTSMYRSLARGLVATIDAVGVSTEFFAGVLVARKLEGIKFALGASIVITRAALEAIGGFAAIADYLADDFLLGNLTAQAGYTVVLSDVVVDHVLGAEGVGDFLRRQRRWAIGSRMSGSS